MLDSALVRKGSSRMSVGEMPLRPMNCFTSARIAALPSSESKNRSSKSSCVRKRSSAMPSMSAPPGVYARRTTFCV